MRFFWEICVPASVVVGLILRLVVRRSARVAGLGLALRDWLPPRWAYWVPAGLFAATVVGVLTARHMNDNGLGAFTAIVLAPGTGLTLLLVGTLRVLNNVEIPSESDVLGQPE